jgi:hypothetical protein
MYITSSSSVINCLIINNSETEAFESGAGIYTSGSNVTISNCTIYNNTGSTCGGIGCNGTATVTDCILWGNGDDLSGCSATYSCIEDGDAGVGNISSDPSLVSGPQGDYYLSQLAAGQGADSPCVDAGSDTAVNLGMDEYTTRTDGIRDSDTVNMGYHYLLIESADIDRDGSVDFNDFGILANQWRDGIGIPAADIYPPGGDGFLDNNDVGVFCAHWLDGFPYPEKATGPSPSDGVDDVSPFVVVSWSAGEHALSRDVYFGTDFNDVNEAGIYDLAFMGKQTETSWDTNDYNDSALEYWTTYYWRIDEENLRGVAKGDVWSFTTREQGVVLYEQKISDTQGQLYGSRG